MCWIQDKIIFAAKSGGVLNDDLIHLAETLLSVVNGPYKVRILNSATLLNVLMLSFGGHINKEHPCSIYLSFLFTV